MVMLKLKTFIRKERKRNNGNANGKKKRLIPK